MNRWTSLFRNGAAALAVAGSAAAAFGDDPPAAPAAGDDAGRIEAPVRPTPPARGPMAGERRGGPRGGDEGDEGAVFRWLERVRETHPEEFARLRHLRETNPEQFRDEMRRRIQRRLGGDEAEGSEPRRGPRPPPRLLERDPDAEHLERELVRLARLFHESVRPEERDELRARIRATLRETFERRDTAWTERIEAMRRDLASFEERVSQWRKTRDEVIEQRLQAMLEQRPEPPAPPPVPAD